MKKVVLISLTLVIVSLFPVNMQAQFPDNLPKERQTSNRQDNRRARYQGDVAYEYIQYFDDEASGLASITTTHGVRFNEGLYAGAGAGLMVWSPYSLFIIPHFLIIPVFATVKGYYPIGDRKKLFTSIDVGYHIGPGSVYFYPRIGISFLHGRHRQINFSIGYQKSFYFMDNEGSNAIGFKVSYSW